MTKVDIAYDLVRPLTDSDSAGIANIHSYYGVFRVKLAATLDKINVEYDASRLTEQDMEAVLHRFGIPIERKWAIP